MRVRVLRRHIAEGVVGDVAACPLALASGYEIDDWFCTDQEGIRYSMSREARRFVHAFDTDGPVKPGWITLYEENE